MSFRSTSAGQANFNDSALGLGNHTVTATFSGSGNFTGSSTTTPLTQVVNKPAPAFTNLSAPTIVLHTALFTLGGTVTGNLPGKSLTGPITITILYASGLKTGQAAYTTTAKIGAGGKFTVSIISLFLPVGAYTIRYSIAADANYAANSVTTSAAVTYAIATPHAPFTGQSNSTIAFTLSLLDAIGTNVSSASTIVTAIGVVSTSSSAVATSSPKTAPTRPPGNGSGQFSFVKGEYQLNLKTTGLAPGSYLLYVMVTGDPVEHAVAFTITAGSAR